MTTEAMVSRMLVRLNRPKEDDLFSYPLEYYQALTDAHQRFYTKVAELRPDLIQTSTTLTSTDGGATFLLTDDHFGELQLYRSPGPPNGMPLVPALPGGPGHYWMEGRTIKMQAAYNGTIHIVWVPATITALDESNDSALPSYCDEAIIWWACHLMSLKPGFLGDPMVFKANADREWRGDPDDPSDGGVVNIIKRQSAHQAWEGADEPHQGVPWWRGIGG